MKNKIIAVILTLTLICSSAFMLASADSVKLGDINNDGNVTASDARLVLRAAAKIDTLSEEATIIADVNFDTRITASDARMILRAAAKIENLPEMPTEENSSAEPTEPTTDPTTEPTTEPTTKPEPDNDVIYAEEYPEAIDAFFGGKYYLEAAIGTGDDVSIMKMAISEKGYEFSASLPMFEGQEAFELSIMQLSKTLYIKYPDVDGKRKVFELDEETRATIKDLAGFDIVELFDSGLFDELNLSFAPSSEKPVYSTGEYNGEECDIYTFDIQDGKLAFYAIGEDVKSINIIDADGNEGTLMNVVQLTKRIPGRMLSTQGCTKVTLLELMDDIMAFIPEDSV